MTPSDEHLIKLSSGDRNYTATLLNDDQTENSGISVNSGILPSRALRDIAFGVDEVVRGGPVHDDPVERGELAKEALLANDAVVHAHFSPFTHTVTAKLTTVSASPVESVEHVCGLYEPRACLRFSRDHGLCLDIEWHVSEYGRVPRSGGQALIERMADYDVHTRSIEADIALREEYDGTCEVVQDDRVLDGAPRISGTRCLVYHIYWLAEERGYDLDGIHEVYPDLSEEDVDVALSYATNHSAEAQEYVDEHEARNAEFRNRVSNTDDDDDDEDGGEFVPA